MVDFFNKCIDDELSKGKVIILARNRQVGKTTLLKQNIPQQRGRIVA